MRFPPMIAFMLVFFLVAPPFLPSCGGEARTGQVVLTVKKEWTSPTIQSWDNVILNDTDRDGASEFIISSFTDSSLRVYDPPNYDLRFSANYSGLYSLETVDLGGNGSVQLLVGELNETGMGISFTVIDGKSFSLLWTSPAIKMYVDHRVRDVDADGHPELIFLNDTLIVYDGATHQKEWTSPVLGNQSASLEVANLDSDGAVEIVAITFDLATNVSNIFAFDGTSHELQWESNVASNGSFNMVLHAGDVDGDSTPELVLKAMEVNETEVLGTAFLVISGASGATEWNFSIEELATQELADLDGDGTPECFVEGMDMEMMSETYNVTFHMFDMKDRKEVWALGPFQNSFGMTDFRQTTYRLVDINGDGLLEMAIINSTMDLVTGSQEGSIAVFSGKNLAQLWKSPTFHNTMFDSSFIGIDPLAPVDLDSDGSPELIISESWVQPPLNRPHGTVYVYSATAFTEEWNTGDLQSYALGFGGQFVKDPSPEMFVLRGNEESTWADILDPSTHQVIWESQKYSFNQPANLTFANILGGPSNEVLFIGIAYDESDNSRSTLYLLNDTTLNQSWASDVLDGEAELLSLGEFDNDSHIEAALKLTKYDDQGNGVSSIVIYDFWEGRPPMPDLALSAPDLVVSNSTPFAAMPLNLTVDLHNIGDANASGCVVAFLVDGNRTDTKTIDIGASNRTMIVFNWTTIQGTHTLAVTADPDKLIDEIEEDNNNATIKVTVVSRPSPTAVIASPREGDTYEEGTQINFSAMGSSAPVGGILSYYWTSDLSGSIGSAANFTAPLTDGIHLITLIINDTFNQASATVNITVTPPKPPVGTTSAVMSSPKNGAVYKAGDQILFDGTNSTAASAAYKLTFKWSSNASGEIETTAKFWKALPAGSHNITLTVDDAHGGMASAYAIIRVRPGEGVVALISSPHEGMAFEADENITFDGTGSAGPLGTILSFSWEDNATGPLGTESRFSRTLPSGDHQVTLTVNDGKGHLASDVVNITVHPRPNQAPRLVVLNPLEGTTLRGMVEISGTAWDDIHVDVIYLRIDGDQPISITGGENWSYSWDTKKAANGNHKLTAWASDGSLQSPEAMVNVTVRNPASSTPPITISSSTIVIALAVVIVLVATVAAVFLKKRKKGPEVVEVAAVEEIPNEEAEPAEEEKSSG